MIYEWLENGVEVLVVSNHVTQSCCLQVWVGTGSVHEEASQRGMAHFLEHMLFKGTQKLGVGDFAAKIEECGGSVNAYTSFDRTVYYLNILGEHAKLGIELLSDCVLHSSLDPGEFKREQEVILEEIRRGLDDPNHRLGQKVFDLAYAESEAGRPIIGFQEQVGSYQRDELMAFYRRWYRPENLKVVAVGAFDEEAFFLEIKKKFGGAARSKASEDALGLSQDVMNKTLKDRNSGWASFSDTPRFCLLKEEFKQPKLEFALPAPDYEHYDALPLDLALYCLGGGEASRLNQKLHVEQGLVASIHMSYYAPKIGGLVSLTAAIPEEHYTEAFTAILAELQDALDSSPILEDELERAKANFKAEKFFQRETLEGLTQDYGYSLTTQQKIHYPEVFQALTDQVSVVEVNAALKRWLRLDRVIVAGLVPKESALSETTLRDLHQAHMKKAAGSAKTSTKKPAIPKAMPVGEPRESIRLNQVGERLKLIYRQNPHSQVFSAVLASEGGVRWESEADCGIQNAMASLLGKSSTKRSMQEVVTYLDRHAADIDGFSGKDSLGMNLSCLGENSESLLKLFAELFFEPTFDGDLWQSEQMHLLELFKAQEDSPAHRCLRMFSESMFPAHPYRFNGAGSPEHVKAFKAQSLLQSFLKHRDASSWVLSCVGPEPASQIEPLLAELFKPLKSAAKGSTSSSTEHSAEAAKPAAKHRFQKMDREQTHICLGYPGMSWGDADRPALDVLANVLGGQGGRLFLRLRDRDSLAYSVSPVLNYGVDPAYFAAYIACASDKVDEAYTKLRQEMERMTEEKLSAEELNRSKVFIVGNHELDIQKGSSQAMTMTVMELYGIGCDSFLRYSDRIKKVQAEDVLRVARRIIRPELMVDSIVGRQDRAPG